MSFSWEWLPSKLLPCFSVLKINFVTKSDKVQIYKKHHINHVLHKAKSKEKKN